MRAADVSQQLFPLTRPDAFSFGRLSCLRSLAIGLTQARRDLGDAEAAADVAERVHLAAHDLMVQLFSLGSKANVEIRTGEQATRECATGRFGPYAAYLAGSLMESDWYLDRASEAHGSSSLAGFATAVVGDFRKRVAQILDADRLGAEIREHPWIPVPSELSSQALLPSMYVVTSTVGDSTPWLTEVGTDLLRQASDLHFTPVPDAEIGTQSPAHAR